MNIHLVGVCGTGMGSFAGLLQRVGHVVRGSDAAAFPPMSIKLAAWGIEVRSPYRAENLDPVPELVVIGNAIRRTNPEAQAVVQRGLRHTSFPAALSDMFLRQRHPVVVAGTHGKTTTTSMIAHLLVEAGLDPSFLVGGIPTNFGEGFRLGGGPHFVVEGDEYDSAFFDKRPKFLHYRPQTLILTSLEYDHADIYPDLSSIVAQFRNLIALVPPDGLILAAADSTNLPLEAARAPVVFYGRSHARHASLGQACAMATEVTHESIHTRFTLDGQRFEMRLAGGFNVDNAVAAIHVARSLGVPLSTSARSLASFEGVLRRQTIRAEVRGIRLIDDFAHHPTAVRATLEGLRPQVRGRLLAVFEPRTATSARRIFQEAFAGAFDGADEVIIAPVGRPELADHERLDVQRLAQDIRARGTPAHALSSVHEIVTHLAAEARSGDALVFMSNGDFGGIHDLMEAALR
ncbi:MAG: UDP-N-acetylmuramate:L-alanyl-gamma-D-glutamyl-meso-diaminopimelate ligase [Myxococcota bacterium]